MAQNPFQPITLHNASGRIHRPNTPNPFTSSSPLVSLQNQHNQRREAQNKRLIEQYIRRKKPQEALSDALKKESFEIQYDLPSLSHIAGTQAYYDALSRISSILESNDSGDDLSILKTVFMVENAYFDGRLDAAWFESEIDSAVTLIMSVLEADGYESTDMMARKMYLQRYMTDTLTLRDNEGSTIAQSTPKLYDFDDMYGKKNWTNMFVSKLLMTNSGQCHSLPLLYLILAEKLGVQAHLSFSPEHSFIALQDNIGRWYNLELTNGHYTTDAWLLSSGYVKAAALRSGIYMRPLSRKETIAHCLFDLAQGYARRFGVDKFVEQCMTKALEVDSNNIFFWHLLSDYNASLLDFTARQIGYPPASELHRYPRVYRIYQTMHKLQRHINALGYEPMPKHLYKQWLKSLDKANKKSFPKP